MSGNAVGTAINAVTTISAPEAAILLMNAP